jgi:DNA-binding protein Fis
MWWVEQDEKDVERERKRKSREKRARQLVDRKLKDYCAQLVGASVSNAEALLNRAVQMHECVLDQPVLI